MCAVCDKCQTHWRTCTFIISKLWNLALVKRKVSGFYAKTTYFWWFSIYNVRFWWKKHVFPPKCFINNVRFGWKIHHNIIKNIMSFLHGAHDCVLPQNVTLLMVTSSEIKSFFLCANYPQTSKPCTKWERYFIISKRSIECIVTLGIVGYQGQLLCSNAIQHLDLRFINLWK